MWNITWHQSQPLIKQRKTSELLDTVESARPPISTSRRWSRRRSESGSNSGAAESSFPSVSSFLDLIISVDPSFESSLRFEICWHSSRLWLIHAFIRSFIHSVSQFIHLFIPIGSVCMVYMLTKRGYIDGKWQTMNMAYGSGSVMASLLHSVSSSFMPSSLRALKNPQLGCVKASSFGHVTP